MRNLRSLTYFGAIVALVGVAACGSDTTEPDSDPVLAIASGNTQSADVGEALGDPIVVRVTLDGSPMSGASVSWSITGGGGSVNPSTATTNASGNAQTTWTMGSTAGANTAQASVSGATGSPVTFTATAVADVPPPMNAAVTVVDDSFDPDERTIAAGGTVTWTWSGTTNQHNVTFASGTNSATQAAGTFMRTFAATGSFPYQCTIHGASMSGTIIVE